MGLSATVLEASTCSDSRTSPPLAASGSHETGSHIMRESLRRALERVRTATNGTFGKRMHARGNLAEPQQLLQLPVRSR